ncbi:hypothetical protein AQUCO_04000011v1 [Aquilegia coerulea]|uniref:F-box domain-containing protein n=1 Tax=Aquilegia coerulea TaxID=218851 RepID=A0A2G5CR26_AQUCA|nr:hypothetical protein AQUCO_04000011v1 [Aquilegia coerulea]
MDGGGGGGGGSIDWSEIPEDVLISIANRLYCVLDYFHLIEVCKPWRSILTSTAYNLLIPQPPPLLMLAESKKKKNTDDPIFRRGFVGLNNKDKVCELHLPELYQRRCVGSTGTLEVEVVAAQVA